MTLIRRKTFRRRSANGIAQFITWKSIFSFGPISVYILSPNKGVETEANKRGGSEVLSSENMKIRENIMKSLKS